MTEQAAIVGVGESEYSWESGKSERDLALIAIRAALADAGLQASDVDGLMKFSFDNVPQNDVAAALGIRNLRYTEDSASGAAAAGAILGSAAAAIRYGLAEVIVCYRAFNGRSMLRLGHLPIAEKRADGHVPAAGSLPFGGEFTGPYGMSAPSCAFGLWAHAYMDRHNISIDRMSGALGRIVTQQRAYAARNPRALLRDKPLDMDGYFKSPILATPLRKVDLCLESDGACAFVIAAPRILKRLQTRPVYILAAAQNLSPSYDQFFFDFDLLPPRIGAGQMPDMLARHGLSHADVDTLGIYDASSASVLYDVENLGFCPYGQGIDFLAHKPPAINTSGGMLAEVYLQGMNLVIEAARQLRNVSANQVKNARVAALSLGGCQAMALLSNEVFS